MDFRGREEKRKGRRRESLVSAWSSKGTAVSTVRVDSTRGAVRTELIGIEKWLMEERPSMEETRECENKEGGNPASKATKLKYSRERGLGCLIAHMDLLKLSGPR